MIAKPMKMCVLGRIVVACALEGVSDVREIGDVDEGIVEGGEDACDAEDELACAMLSVYMLLV